MLRLNRKRRPVMDWDSDASCGLELAGAIGLGFGRQVA
jgi:hypothetical protein